MSQVTDASDMNASNVNIASQNARPLLNSFLGDCFSNFFTIMTDKHGSENQFAGHVL